MHATSCLVSLWHPCGFPVSEADFGLAKQKQDNSKLTSVVGTILYSWWGNVLWTSSCFQIKTMAKMFIVFKIRKETLSIFILQVFLSRQKLQLNHRRFGKENYKQTEQKELFCVNSQMFMFCVLVQRWWRMSLTERKLISGRWAVSSTRWPLYVLHSTAVTCCRWPTRQHTTLTQTHTHTHTHTNAWQYSIVYRQLLIVSSCSLLVDCGSRLRAGWRRLFFWESDRHDQMVGLLFWN